MLTAPAARPASTPTVPRLTPLTALPATRLHVPAWIWVSAALLVLYPLAVLVYGRPEAFGRPFEIVASIARLIIEGGAFLWAAGRHELPARLRLALRITGWTSLGSSVNYLLLLAPLLGGPVLLSGDADALLTLALYLTGVAALLVYPRAPARPGERASFVIDLLITAGGLGLLAWVLVTQPSVARVVDAEQQRMVIAFGLAQLAMLVGVNLVIVRGHVSPSRRAFWWFVVGQAMYVPVVILAQLEQAFGVDPRWGTVCYFWGVLPTLVAAVAMRGDGVTVSGEGRGPAWIRDFNPLPLAAPVAIGASLLLLLRRGHYADALPLAATLVTVSLLLAVRLLLSARHSAWLARTEADNARRRQAEKLQALGRLAGGVAHEFNNLMARVVGHAELGETSLAPGDPARDNFARVKAAAMRAAELTRQLLAFSGQQRTKLVAVDVGQVARQAVHDATLTLPDGIIADTHLEAEPLSVHGDTAQLAVAITQLVENAVEAMPRGGRLELRVSRAHVQEPFSHAVIAVPPGHYVAIAVGDTGVGIAPEALALVCDPFYSTKAPHLGAGLGLASVHGIVASHAGGLSLESTVGVGTRVTVYLPAR